MSKHTTARKASSVSNFEPADRLERAMMGGAKLKSAKDPQTIAINAIRQLELPDDISGLIACYHALVLAYDAIINVKNQPRAEGVDQLEDWTTAFSFRARDVIHKLESLTAADLWESDFKFETILDWAIRCGCTGDPADVIDLATTALKERAELGRQEQAK